MEALSRSACVAPRAPSHSRGLSSRGACSAPLRAQSAAPRRAQLTPALAAKGKGDKGDKPAKEGKKGAAVAAAAVVVPVAAPVAPADPAGSTAPQEFTTPNLGFKVTVTSLPSSRRRLRAELPLSVLQTSYAAVLTELGEGASLPGFRKGATAPPKVLVAAVGNARFRAACVEHLLQATLEEVCSPLRDQSFQDSEKIVTPMETLTQAFAGAACAPTAALVFDTEVDVMPSLSWTRDYRKLALTVPSPPSEEQLEASAKAALATRRKELGELRVVAGGRGLMAGDVVRLNISAQRIGADGAPGELILSMQHKNLFFDTEVDGAQLPGFVAACEGLKPSESRVFQLAFPQEWNTEALRGVTASFTAACLELFSRTLPDVDDALAPKLRDGCHTLAEVHAALLSDARASAADAADNARRMAVLDALSSAADVQIPQSLFQETGRNLYSAQLLELQAKGQLSPGAMRQMMADSLVEQFFKNKRADIESKVLTGLAVAEVARAEGLCVSEERLAAEVAQGVADFKRWGASYDEQRLTEQAREGLLAQQVLDWVLERATVTEQR